MPFGKTLARVLTLALLLFLTPFAGAAGATCQGMLLAPALLLPHRVMPRLAEDAAFKNKIGELDRRIPDPEMFIQEFEQLYFGEIISRLPPRMREAAQKVLDQARVGAESEYRSEQGDAWFATPGIHLKEFHLAVPAYGLMVKAHEFTHFLQIGIRENPHWPLYTAPLTLLRVALPILVEAPYRHAIEGEAISVEFDVRSLLPKRILDHTRDRLGQVDEIVAAVLKRGRPKPENVDHVRKMIAHEYSILQPSLAAALDPQISDAKTYVDRLRPLRAYGFKQLAKKELKEKFLFYTQTTPGLGLSCFLIWELYKLIF